ncbi:MAG: phosphoribosylformylglycinamidine cyclo-ligase [Deltaproteobacteria bacterium]
MLTYKDSGVNVEAGYKSVELIKKHVKNTFRSEVLTDLGGFGGLFALSTGKYKEPVLVSGTDGVGTKLKIAFLTDKHDTIGQDCVAMCVNDVICCGAEPLFFLDYLAVGKNVPEQIEQIVKGVADGCVLAGCSLVGGETAEMPGFYKEDEYDLAGFCVGIVDKSKIIDGKSIKSGDSVIGISSSGIHSNGYSMVRKVLNPSAEKLREYVKSLGCTLGEELLKPTKIYVKPILKLLESFELKGIANMTGGGFYENIPRTIPEGLRVKINKGSWPVLPIFNLIQDLGNIEEKEMFNTFNMGIGMVVVVDSSIAEEVISYISSIGEKAYLIGEIIEGEAGVELC